MLSIPIYSPVKVQVKEMDSFLSSKPNLGMLADIGKKRSGGAFLRADDQKVGQCSSTAVWLHINAALLVFACAKKHSSPWRRSASDTVFRFPEMD
jgi:hypothetical protein